MAKCEAYDDDPSPWKKSIDYTDMPDGQYEFVLVDDGIHRGVRCILLSEY